MDNKIYLFILALLLVLPLCSANLGSSEQGECVSIRVLANCSSVDLIEVTNTNKGDTYIINEAMTLIGGQTFNYSFCNTTNLGHYTYSWSPSCIDCSEGDCGNSFDITPSGREAITQGESSSLIIATVIMLIIASLFFIMGFKVDNLAGKIILIGTAVLLLLAIFLFSLVIMTQILGGFSTILEGYTTFWFIVKIIFGIALTALTLFILWFSYQAFMIKRGFRD